MGRLWVRQSEDDAVSSAVSRFGAEVKPRLQGPGEAEDQLRAPTEALVKSIAQVLGVEAVLHGEVRLADLRARPDYQVDVAGAPGGFIEIKRPGRSADPNNFRGKDAAPWKKLSLLPNVLYTDGDEWALWRNVEHSASTVRINALARHAARRPGRRERRFFRL